MTCGDDDSGREAAGPAGGGGSDRGGAEAVAEGDGMKREPLIECWVKAGLIVVAMVAVARWVILWWYQ